MAEFVEPRVYFISETTVDQIAVHEYLESIGAEEWHTDAETDAEYLAEIQGRICYKSWFPTLNPNVTRVRKGNENYLNNIIKSRHGRIFEGSNVGFIFQDVSRVFTHELITHKVGTTQSQESLRFVRLDRLKFYLPECFVGIEEYVRERLEIMEEWQREMAVMFDLDNPKMPFEKKKEITSAMRRLSPQGLGTSLIWTCNLRAARTILELRTSIHAESEIRFVFNKVGYILQEKYPIIFGDFVRNENGEWQTPNSKI